MAYTCTSFNKSGIMAGKEKTTHIKPYGNTHPVLTLQKILQGLFELRLGPLLHLLNLVPCSR